MKKQGRNELCNCGSGLKYKYCCAGKDLREQKIPLWSDPKTGEKLSLNMTDDILNWAATVELPIKNFCKDNDIYFFGLAATVGETQELDNKLKKGLLTKQDVLDTFKKNAKKESIMRLLDACFEEMEIFAARRTILKDAFDAHFNEKYTLSIPALFSQLEGLLRDIGGLHFKDTIKPTIPTNIWDKKLLFAIKDDAQNFNNFITKLFSGSTGPDAFNRNPILHGFKLDYHSEEHSLLIILSILELRMFNWWQRNVEDFTNRFQVSKIDRKKEE
ncbi:MAG: SEC-C domain-containing protein [Bacteroidales bacterium]